MEGEEGVTATHFFVHEHATKGKSGGLGGGGKAAKALQKEYRRLMKGQLPAPHPNATIAVRFDPRWGHLPLQPPDTPPAPRGGGGACVASGP